MEEGLNSELTSDNYIEERVNRQIEWYDSKSKEAKKRYKIFTYVILISSAFIPLLTNLAIEQFGIKLIVSFLGVFTTLSQGIINLNDYNENWIEYRTVCETLKKEKYMFLAKSGVYNDTENPYKYFVERIESIISQENVNWANIKKEDKER